MSILRSRFAAIPQCLEFRREGHRRIRWRRRCSASQCCFGRKERCLARFEMTTQCLVHPLSQCGRAFDENIVQGAKEIWKLLFRPVEHVLREKSAPRTKFLQTDLRRTIPERATSRRIDAPAGAQRPRARRSMYRNRRPCRTARRCASSIRVRVVVKTHLHVAREGKRATFADFLFDLLAEGLTRRHILAGDCENIAGPILLGCCYSPFRWRSARSCGVRMNISTK